MPLTQFVRVRAQVEGLHRWPDATGSDGYLASPHRHVFTAELDISVVHDDRELEINAVSRWIHEVLASFAATPLQPDGPADFGAQSCEQLATRLVRAVADRFGLHRSVRCAVLEDGLLGGGVQWLPDPATEPGS
jgi:hypothetical protein